MSPLCSREHARLFQPWSLATEPEQALGEAGDFIELPSVSSYQQLQSDSDFPVIHARFLSDIRELRELAHRYVNDLYDRALDIFHDKLAAPGGTIQDSLLPLYRDTRFRIHQLVLQLRHPDIRHEDYIAIILHECLSGIHLCPGGVYSRFANVLPNLHAVCHKELDGILFKARYDLFRSFVQSYMLQQQQECLDLGEEMEVHWFNGLYNLYCENLALPPIEDSLANACLNDQELDQFLSAAELSVSAFAILRKISEQWSELLAATLASVGYAHWLRRPTGCYENTAVGINVLNTQVFSPINCQMRASVSHALDLTMVMDCTSDDSFHLGRHREKLFAWLTGHFFRSDTRVFASLGSTGGKTACIATINQLYFWVLESDQPMHIGQTCHFVPEQHQSLQLGHLQAIDFSTWTTATALALLTQALEQTSAATEVAEFFLNPQVVKQIQRLPGLVMQTLTILLREKLVYRDEFKHQLRRQVCQHFACATVPVSSTTLGWLHGTPLMLQVLVELHRRGRDISQVTAQLNTRQISEFPAKQISELLTSADCQRLFAQACRLGQAQIIFKLVLTGHCHDLILKWEQANKDNSPGSSNRGTILSGASYLLAIDDINHAQDNGMPALCNAIGQRHWLVVRVLLNVPGIDASVRDKYGMTPLHHAALNGRHEVVSALIDLPGVNVNAIDHNGSTPLHRAADGGHPGAVRALLRARDIDANAVDRDGMTALIIAANADHASCIRELIRMPAVDVNAISTSGWTALCGAAQFGHINCVRALLKGTNIKVNLPTYKYGWTPLFCAAEKDRLECLKELLAIADIDVNRTNHGGFTPLHVAADHGSKSCLEALLAKPELDINQVASDGFRAIHFACQRGSWQCVRLLLSHPGIRIDVFTAEGDGPLNLSVRTGNLRCVQALVELCTGRIVNHKVRGWSPLNRAAEMGNPAIVRALLSVSGVDVNASNDDDWSPLHCAVRQNHIWCTEALLSRPDIAINAVTRTGHTALNIAVRYGSVDCLKLLLKHPQVDVNQACYDGMTPLHTAVQEDQPLCLGILLSMRGIELNRLARSGLTALELAAENGRLACLKVLLKVPDIQVNLSPRYGGGPPLHRAAAKGFVACVKELLSAPGIEINKQCDRGYTALHQAAQNGYPACVQELLSAPGVDASLPCRLGRTPQDIADRTQYTQCSSLLKKQPGTAFFSNDTLER